MKKVFTSGYALLFTMVLISIISAIAIGMSTSVYKQMLLSSTARESQTAFYQADTAIECALYATEITTLPAISSANGGTDTFNCGHDSTGAQITLAFAGTGTTSDPFTFTPTGSITGPCFSFDIDPVFNATDTNVSAHGYNLCDLQEPRLVERGLEALYTSVGSGNGGSGGGGGGSTNTFTFIGSTSGTGNAYGAVSSPLDISGANLLVLSVASYVPIPNIPPPVIPPTVWDLYGNTWIPLPDHFTPGGIRNQMYYAVPPLNIGPADTFTVNSSSFVYATINVQAFASTGIPTFDKEMGNGTGVGFTAQPGSIVPSVGNSLIVTGLNSWGATPISVNSGFNMTSSNAVAWGSYFASGMAYLIQTVRAPANPIWTLGNSSSGIGIGIAAFRP